MLGMDCVNQQARRDLIGRLSDLRSQYNLFDENEQGAYHTLTEAIAVLNEVNESAQPTQTNTPNTLEALDCIRRQDAVDIINGYEEQFNGYIGTPNDSEVYAYARGLLLGIERNISALLSAQPEIEERMSETEQNVPNDDFISRKMAIDALMEDFKRIPTNAIRAKTVIEQLPPAKPEIIRCKDCMHNGSFDTDCPIDWAGKEYCNFAERRTDE